MNETLQLELKEPVVDYDSQSEFTDEDNNRFVKVDGYFQLAEV